MGQSTANDAVNGGIPDIRWLIAGGVAGLVIAAFGILRQADSGNDLPANVLAKVNGEFISRDEFDRALERVGAGAGADDDAAWVLQRLIDNELLVQRGLELGMAASDLTVRTAIINSLVASVTAEADAANPPEEELAQYLADNAERFGYIARISLEAWQTDDETVAQTFVTALRNDGRRPLSEAISPLPGLPAGLAPVEQLRDLLGPGITAAAADMPAGSSAVFARRGRWLVVQVLAKEPALVTDLHSIRNRVLLDYRRNLAESTLRSYLDDLRRRAEVVVAQP